MLAHGELITTVDVPLPPPGTRSGYLKVRDRASYEFALTSVAAALVIDEGLITMARLALGGVGTIPWRAREAEDVLTGASASDQAFRAAAAAALRDPCSPPCSAFRKTTLRVLVPYLGGGLGAGLITWPHVIIAALAARVTGRPVKLVLTRPQMFTSVGHRPQTVQRLRLGATRDFTLTAIDHDATSTVGAQDATMEPVTAVTPLSYACVNVATHGRQVRLNVPNPGWLRAPGKAVGNFPLESALDELSYALGIDPVDLRLRNHADVNPQSGRPWSSNALRECYQAGAEHFGWAGRDPAVRSMRDGQWLVGNGMAGVTFGGFYRPCRASITLSRDGTARVRSAATDIGTGTYTVAAQLTAELLGLRTSQVVVEIGDSDLPPAPSQAGRVWRRH